MKAPEIYRAEDGTVYKNPVRTPNPQGGETISIGFPVCRMLPAVGDDAAESVAGLMNLGEMMQAHISAAKDAEPIARALEAAAARMPAGRAATYRRLAAVMRQPGFAKVSS